MQSSERGQSMLRGPAMSTKIFGNNQMVRQIEYKWKKCNTIVIFPGVVIQQQQKHKTPGGHRKPQNKDKKYLQTILALSDVNVHASTVREICVERYQEGNHRFLESMWLPVSGLSKTSWMFQQLHGKIFCNKSGIVLQGVYHGLALFRRLTGI